MLCKKSQGRKKRKISNSAKIGTGKAVLQIKGTQHLKQTTSKHTWLKISEDWASKDDE